MTEAEIKKYQKTQILLLREVDKICREQGLSYYMIGGTLLGAVRHGGFIPWDADIDIAMRREDYDRFKQYWMQNPSEVFFYQDFETEKNHLSPHALLRFKGTRVGDQERFSPVYNPKERGIFLDIFPLDTPPQNRALQYIQMKHIQFLRWLIKIKIGLLYYNTPSWKKAVKTVARLSLFPISLQTLNKMLDKVMRKYTGCNSGFLVSMASHYSYRKQLMPEDIYGTPVPCKFENEVFLATEKTDAYLTRIYGNYMQLPPAEKQVFPKSIDHIDYGALERNDDFQRFTKDI